MKTLFIIKQNKHFQKATGSKKESGLSHSTEVISKSIGDSVVEHIGNVSEIHQLIKKYNPEKVVIEAVWLPAEKFHDLKIVHPRVKWYVHLHSQIPFLAIEGQALGLLMGYIQHGVKLIANSKESFNSLSVLYGKNVEYLPNLYLKENLDPVRIRKDKVFVDVACFGSIRPMKNHLTQAMGAIKFARQIRKPLRFWVNSTRVEGGGHPVLSNLINMFEGLEDAQMIASPWIEPEKFRQTLRDEIDIGLQVSMSETFNVVAADMVTAGLPVVGSPAIKWLSPASKVLNIEDADEICHRMKVAYLNDEQRQIVQLNQHNLSSWSRVAKEKWIEWQGK